MVVGIDAVRLAEEEAWAACTWSRARTYDIDLRGEVHFPRADDVDAAPAAGRRPILDSVPRRDTAVTLAPAEAGAGGMNTSSGSNLPLSCDAVGRVCRPRPEREVLVESVSLPTGTLCTASSERRRGGAGEAPAPLSGGGGSADAHVAWRLPMLPFVSALVTTAGQ